MKKTVIFTTVVALFTVWIPSEVEAQHPGCGVGAKKAVPAEALKTMQKFKKETKGLQIKLIDKEALLKKAFLNDNPDPDTIATIKKAIIDIKRDMQKIAKKLGMKHYMCTCRMSHGHACGWSGHGGMSGCGKK